MTSNAAAPPQLRHLLPALLSGAAALSYETLWSRWAAFAFGADGPAEAAVLGATMAGLGLGALLLRGRAARLSPAQGLRLFALLELAAALFALASPWLISLAGELGAGGAEGASLALSRALAASLVILPGALLLGATFPALVAAAGQGRARGEAAARVYAVNLGGAACGIGLTSFLTVPLLGHTASLFVAAGLGLGAAVLAVALQRGAETRAPEELSEASEGSAPPYAILLLVATIAGARTIALEGLGTRLLRLLIGGGLPSFALMLLIFLAGLAAGSAAATRIPRRRVWEAAVGAELLSLAGCWLVSRWLPSLQASLPEALAGLEAGASLTPLRLELGAWLLLPLALPAGLTLPLLMRLCPGASRASGAYALNSLGALVGALLTSLWLIPNLGSLGALQLWGALTGLAALALAASRSRLTLTLAAALAGVLGLLLGAASWPASVLTQGHYARLNPRDPDFGERRIVFAQDGLGALVSVEDRPKSNARVLRTHGKIEGAVPINPKQPSEADLSTALALAAVPSMLVEETGRACVIGLGTGVTLGAMTTFDYAAIDAVEIEPAVIAALRDEGELFARMNGRALEDPRVTVFATDGAAFLRGRAGAYDLITSQPSDPWLSGAALLLTRDFYERVRQALAPSGLFCQWFQLYALDEDGVRAGLATFLEVFPGALAFHPPGRAEILLIGAASPSGAPLPPLPELTRRLAERGQRGVATPAATPPSSFLASFLSGPEHLRAFAGDAPVETLDRPRLAQRASQLLYTPISEVERLIAKLAEGAEALAGRLKAPPLERLAVLQGAAEAAALRGQIHAGRAMLRGAIAAMEREDAPAPLLAEGWRLLGDLLYGDANSRQTASERDPLVVKAVEAWRAAIALDPAAPAPRRSLATWHIGAERIDEALEVLRAGLGPDPQVNAPLHFMIGRIEEARREYEAAAESYRAASGYGQARERLARLEQVAAQEGSPLPEPIGPKARDIELLIKGGRQHIRDGDWRRAVSTLKEATRMDPSSAQAWLDLARAYAGAEAWEPALAAAAEAIARSPDGAEKRRAERLRAELLTASGDLAAALDAQRGLAATADSELARLNAHLAAAHLAIRLERYDDALSDLDEARAIVPEHLLERLYRGAALAAKGRDAEARAAYEGFLELAPAQHPSRADVEAWLLDHPG